MKRVTKKLCALLLTVILLAAPLMNVAASQGDEFVTRGQFASLVAEAFQLPLADSEPAFYDVPADHPFASAIASVNAFKFMVGNSSGYFFPDAILSGAEAAVWLNNMIGFDGSLVSQASLPIPAWAVPSASVLLDLTMVDAQLIGRSQLTLNDATQFISAAALALMIAPGTPYALQQARMQDNFFAYMNRQFLATAPMPPGAIMAWSFGDVSTKVIAQQEIILSEILNNPNLEVGSDEWRIRELYNMFLDNETRTASISMLEPYFDLIRNIESMDELLEVARAYSAYVNLVPFYSMGFARDTRNDATQWAAFITAAPLSFGNRDLYVNDPTLAPLHAAYIDLTATLLTLAGETENVQERAEAIFALEQERAANMLPQEAWADFQQSRYVTVTWDEVLEATSVTGALSFNEPLFERALEMTVYSAVVDYLAFIDSLFVEENLQVLKDYALVMFLMSYVSILDDEFSGLTDALMSVMFGQPMGGDLTIEDRGQQFVTSVMWRTFSRAYYQRFSSQEVKQDVIDMSEDIRAVMRDMITDIPWMTYETRLASIEKLDAVTLFIAFPDEPVYEMAFDIRPQSEGGNLIEFMQSMARLNDEMWVELLDGPANISMWEQVPTSTVNAFYSPWENAITIPAGILQYPFYCVTNTREQNLGAIGAVIAHEFVHAFDPMGSEFDKYGTMTMWWTQEDVDAFDERMARVIAILNSIEFAGMNLIGALNVNEAVTDLGAMEVAMTVVAGMEDANPAQVMESWAKIWASRMTPEVAIFMMMNAPHLPAMLRANFILSQLDEFYEVFGVVAGDGMYIPVEERISFWR